MVSERVKRGLTLQEPLIGDFIMPITGEIHAVRMVTSDTLAIAQERVQKGQHVIVIPILGYDFEHINFEGEMGEIVTRILETEQISPNRFRFHTLPVLSSRGSFRRLLITLQKLQIEYLTVNGEFAVKMQFNLIKGSYASVVLREFMKPKSPTQL
jgi:tRNA(Glu) U13 pseudouridine synthase TruD